MRGLIIQGHIVLYMFTMVTIIKRLLADSVNLDRLVREIDSVHGGFFIVIIWFRLTLKFELRSGPGL